MFYPANSTTLTDWLNYNGIDTSHWGSDGAKSVENLWEEIRRGETVLLENPARRSVSVAQVWICRDNLLLVETAQTFDDGSVRALNTLPAEKILPGENPSQTALRCVQEELQISQGEATLTSAPIECSKKDADSFSYPGLHSVYTFYRVALHAYGLPTEPFVTDELAHGTGDPVVSHHWAWTPIDAYQSR